MAELETIRAPRIRGELLVGLQRALNEREIVAIAQPRSKGIVCASKQRDGDRIVGCAELAAFHHLDEAECSECGKMKKDADDPFCVAHMALRLSGELQDVQTDLFEVDPETKAASAQRDHNHEDDEPPAEEPEPEAPAIDGTTGAPIGTFVNAETGVPLEATAESRYTMTPDPQNPELCVCGFLLASPVAGALHDERHERYALAIGEAIPRAAAPKAGDVTRAAARRGRGKAGAAK